MALLVRMPQKGLSEESAILSGWYVKEGDSVKKGDFLFSIETGKATFDVESEQDGIVLKTIGTEGDEIPVKKLVCAVGQPGESCEEEDSVTDSAPAAASAPASAPAATSAGAPACGRDGTIRISPRARTMAEEKGIDLRGACGTGPDGRVIERDIEAMAKSGPFITKAARPFAGGGEAGTGLSGAVTTADLGKTAALAGKTACAATVPEYEIVKNSRMRKLIATNMRQSLQTMAQLTHNSYADASGLMILRARVKAEGANCGLENVTLNDMVLFAVSRTILDFPELNAHYSDDEIKLFRTVNLGVAVDTPRGLLVPTIRYAETLTLNEISRQMKELSAECQNGSISPDKLSGASFTVSNLGAFGVTTFTPIINPPQTGILGVCNIEHRVRMKGGAPEFYPTINLSLTYDHRAMDGAPASRFLQALAKNIANIDLLLAK